MSTFVIGDPAGPEMHTHVAHYQGEIAVHIALGEDVKPDFSAIPRATYTDPETAGVGLLLDEATERGHDAFEETADLASSAKGNVSESYGHATVVVDRKDSSAAWRFHRRPGSVRGDPRVRARAQDFGFRSRCWRTRSTPSRRRRG